MECKLLGFSASCSAQPFERAAVAARDDVFDIGADGDSGDELQHVELALADDVWKKRYV